MDTGFVWGGFEGASHRRLVDLGRVDSVASSGHERWAYLDHALPRSLGMRCARESLRWHLIERVPGVYDFTSALQQVRAARAAGVAVVWGICHWGLPDHIDVWSAEFPQLLAAFAKAVARMLREEGSDIAGWVPVNEMAFWAWAGGATGGFHPFHTLRGDFLKWQLVLGHLAVVQALRGNGAFEPIMVCEPLIMVHAQEGSGSAVARGYMQASTAAIEWILAADPSAIDVIGWNFYPHNQWREDDTRVPRGDPHYRPLRNLLHDVAERFGRPLVLSETGAEEPDGVGWLSYVAAEAEAALQMGVPLRAICIYPVTDYAGWDNARHCECGPIGSREGRRFVREWHRQLIEQLSVLDVRCPARPADDPFAAGAGSTARMKFSSD